MTASEIKKYRKKDAPIPASTFHPKAEKCYLKQAGLLARPGCCLPIPFSEDSGHYTSVFICVKAFTATGIAPEFCSYTFHRTSLLSTHCAHLIRCKCSSLDVKVNFYYTVFCCNHFLMSTICPR